MTRIEKTQINTSAFIILVSTLKEIQSDNTIEIANEGRGIVYRKKEEHEKDDFTIDLDFLNEIFKALVGGDPRPLALTGEAEGYLRNCSFACYYYRKENERIANFDHFDLFHEIHFPKLQNLNLDESILKLLCGLFRVDFEICRPFLNSENGLNRKIDLPPKKVFNEIFSTIAFSNQDNFRQLTFESGILDMTNSLDSLFATKDLLFARGINTTSIPEYNMFSIQQHEEVKFPFTASTGLQIQLTFRYDYFKVDIKRNK